MNKFLTACFGLAIAVVLSVMSTSAQNVPTANPAADLDQCRNGGVGEPVVQCLGDGNGASGWVNGNAGPENAHWAESQYIVYRMRFSNLSIGTHTVIIGYDIFQQTKHAIDYLGTYNKTATDAVPCDTVDGCGGTPSTFPIPQDTVTVTNKINPNTGLNVVQESGDFTLWGGTITNVQYVTYAGGDERQIAVTFTNTVSNPVLAWGGHIAWIGDWGAGNSASAINGSPYHMRLIGLDGEGGNQDRSLKNTAVTPSGAAVIKKVVNTVDGTGSSSQAFGFTATSGFSPSTFSLVDDNNGPGIDVQLSQPITTFGSTITVSEDTASLPAPWSLLNIVCVDSGTANSTPQSPGGLGSAQLKVDAGEVVICTFTNSNLRPTAAPANVAGRVLSGSRGISGALLILTDLNSGEIRIARTNMFGYYTIANASTETTYLLTVSAKGYSFTNSSRTFTLMDNLSGFDFVASPPPPVQPTSMAPTRRSVFGLGTKTQLDQ